MERDPKVNPNDDPLIGMRETTDSPAEAHRAPPDEVALEPQPVGPATRSRWVAGWLGVFLGWLGVHRFYLGFYRIGAFQAALSIGAALLMLVLALAISPDPSWSHLALAMLSVIIALGLWGFFEGVAILFGRLTYDAHLHPLRGNH